MYPHLRPAGIIMKLEREPIEEFDEAIFTKDRQFWREYSKRLIGDWISEDTPVEEICNWIERTYQRRDLSDFEGSHEFVRDNDAQKGFSKLRAAIAGLYTWRSLNTRIQPYDSATSVKRISPTARRLPSVRSIRKPFSSSSICFPR